MANRSRSSNNQDNQVSSSPRLRANSRQTINSSLNQLNVERLGEKAELQSLNDRHANLVNRHREEQKEKAALQEQLRITEENADQRVRECQASCEKRVQQYQSKFEAESRSSAKKSIEIERYRQADKEHQNEINALASDLKQLEKRNAVLANELESLRPKLSAAVDEKERLRKLLQNLEAEKNAAEKNAKNASGQAEAERLRCVSLENRLAVLEEKIASQAEEHQHQLEELRARHEQEMDEQITEAVESELKYYQTDLMVKTGRELEEKTNNIRLELERTHSAELARLREQLSKALSSEKALNVKVNSYQPLLDKLHAQIHQHNVIQGNLNNRILELEGLIEIERKEKADLLEAKTREVRELQEELEAKDSENQKVLDANVLMRDEMRIYRNLLDEQEKAYETDPNTSAASKGSPGQRRYLQAVRKRKRDEEVNETTIVNKSVGPIAIDESTEQYIRLVNRSEEPVSLAGWELKRETNDEGQAFKFSKSILVQPGETVTVYSVDADGATHNPPVTIKLKKNWPVGGVTTLVNASKEEIARWEASQHSKRGRFNRSGDEANTSCVLM